MTLDGHDIAYMLGIQLTAKPVQLPRVIPGYREPETAAVRIVNHTPAAIHLGRYPDFSPRIRAEKDHCDITLPPGESIIFTPADDRIANSGDVQAFAELPGPIQVVGYTRQPGAKPAASTKPAAVAPTSAPRPTTAVPPPTFTRPSIGAVPVCPDRAGNLRHLKGLWQITLGSVPVRLPAPPPEIGHVSQIRLVSASGGAIRYGWFDPGQTPTAEGCASYLGYHPEQTTTPINDVTRLGAYSPGGGSAVLALEMY